MCRHQLIATNIEEKHDDSIQIAKTDNVIHNASNYDMKSIVRNEMQKR